MASKETVVQQQFLDALKKIDRPGTFCTSGRVPPAIPGLEVADIGPIGLPLEKGQAAALKKVARQAPYGKRTQTLVDTDVRRVWEVDAQQVSFANPEWQEVVQQIVRTVQVELGLEKQQLEANFYKLLLYEKGSFFLGHRDGEKLDRMVATLVIALPAAHEGGELVVRHEGREVVVDFGAESRFQTQYAAFYSDCEHEVRPLTSGFRLSLVYNLTLAKSKKRVAAPTSSEHIDKVAGILEQWSKDAGTTADSDKKETPSKLAVLLDHQYSEAGLVYDVLKGIDRARADVLFAAAKKSACDASLALVTYWESGSAEPSGDYGYYNRYNRYNDDNTGDSGEHVMGEVYDTSLTAEHFTDAEGNRLGFGSIPVGKKEIISEIPLGEGDPDEEDFEGFTGNAGMTLERWYHRAAVMLWPTTSRFDVLCDAGVESAVGGLAVMVKQWKRAAKSKQTPLKQPCLEFAGRIIAHWPSRESGYRSYRERNKNAVEQESLISLLKSLEDPSLISAWIRGVLAKDVSVEPGKILGDVCRQRGWLTFQGELRDLFEATSNNTLERHAQLLADLSLRRDKNADRISLCVELAQQMIAAVERWKPRPDKRNWQDKTVDLAELLPPLVESFIAVDEAEFLDRLVEYVLDRPKEFDVTTTQIPALVKLSPWLTQNVKRPCAPLHRWLAALANVLEIRSSSPPQPPSNWRRESATGCNCKDCQELSRFLENPNLETLTLPLAQNRRQHLHQIIDSNKLDTTHVTERRGSPFKLAFTKTKGSYERDVQTHLLDLSQLGIVNALLEWHEKLKNAEVAS
ncbi:MAG: 2OG-Fe(II) oxygenase [Planctomycetaceae bacterium]